LESSIIFQTNASTINAPTATYSEALSFTVVLPAFLVRSTSLNDETATLITEFDHPILANAPRLDFIATNRSDAVSPTAYNDTAIGTIRRLDPSSHASLNGIHTATTRIRN